ncbi:MAG: phenylacetate--CoA ligase family protein [Acidobacteriales bacterium]|nr:phenylacetate--CoA ligase family protein [Terriglobales bacterium]
MILDTGATVLLCTPSYALHLAEVSRREGINLRDLQVRITIHAGEPGASIPGTRARIQETWNALVIDHAGATEVGAYGLGCLRGRGVHVNEEEFIAEVVRPGTCEPAAEGELGELVITNLGRGAWPVIRYRTGDLVRARRGLCECGSSYLLLDGGIVGRADEMITVRGMNVFPSALEDVIRSVADLAEYRIIVTKNGEMDELVVELEASRPQCNQVSQTIRHQMGIRVNVRPAAPGSLSCSDGKAGRIVDLRHAR